MSRMAMLFLGSLLAMTAMFGFGDNVSASGDQVQHTHGEDPGYYDENNNNPFDDVEFPGLSLKNRTGM